MRKHLLLAPAGLAVALLVSEALAATISFTVPDAIVPDLVAGMTRQYGRLDGETDAQLVRRITRDRFWREIVNDERRRAAAATAVPVGDGDLGNN